MFSLVHRLPDSLLGSPTCALSPSAADSGQEIRNLCAEGGQQGFCEVLGGDSEGLGV